MEAICNPKSPRLLNANVLFLLIYGLAGSVYSTPRTIDSSGACNALLQPLEVLLHPGQELFLDSPGFPIFYPSSSFCEWKVSTYNNGYIIQVTTVFVQLENDADNVEVFDGYSSVNHSLLHLSLTIMTRNITIHSSGQRLYIRFRSDSSTNFQGFRFNVTAVPSNTAPANFACSSLTRPVTLVADPNITQNIRSPGYPAKYPNNANCEWLITTVTRYVVRIFIQSADLEQPNLCTYDYVDIFNGYNASAQKTRICNSSAQYIYSSGPVMFIRFVSDSSSANSGFFISYSAFPLRQTTGNTKDACSPYSRPQYLSAFAGETRFIESPGFSTSNTTNNYPNSVTCEWLITTFASRYVVQLNTVIVDLESLLDTINVYDGTSARSGTLIRSFWNNQSSALYSSGQSMYIKFTSHGYVTRMGFRLSYTAILRTSVSTLPTTTFNWNVLTTAGSNQDAYGACSSMRRPRELSIFYGGRNFIESPNYPYSYPSNAFCAWIISTNSSAYVVQLETTLIALEIDSDVIKVYNGLRADTEKLLRAISSTEYTPVVSTGQWMYIEFRSDISVEYTGFRLSYTAVQPVPSTPSNDLNLPPEINSNSAVIISSALGTMSVVAIFALVFVSLCKRRRRPLRLSVPSGNMAVLYSNVFIQAGSQGGRSAQFNDDIYEVSALYPRMPVSVYPCAPPSYDNIAFTTFCNEEYTEPVPSIPPPEYGDAPPEYSYYQQNATASV